VVVVVVLVAVVMLVMAVVVFAVVALVCSGSDINVECTHYGISCRGGYGYSSW
jgi:hypothetical protein